MVDGALSLFLVVLVAVVAYYRFEFIIVSSFLGFYAPAIAVSLPGKVTTLWVVTAVFLALGVSLSLVKDFRETRLALFLSAASNPLTFFLLFLFMYATLLGYMPEGAATSEFSFYRKDFLALLFLPTIALFLFTRSERNLLWILVGIVAVSFLNYTYSLMGYVESEGYLNSASARLGANEQGFSRMGITGTFSISAIILYWAAVTRESGRFYRILLLALTALMVYGIVLSATRSTLISLAIGIVYVQFFSEKGSPAIRGAKRSSVMFSLPFIFIAVVVVGAVTAGANLQSRLGFDAWSSNVRFDIWTRAVGDFLDGPILGVGPFNWGSLVQTEVLDRETNTISIVYGKEPTENVLLTVALEMGIVGVILYVLAWRFSWPGRVSRSAPDFDLVILVKALLLAELFRSQFYGSIISWSNLCLVLGLGGTIKSLRRCRSTRLA